YTDSFGVPALRERIGRHYREVYGVDVATESIVVTTGSSAAFVLSFLAAFDVGDRVALASPGYPAYRNILNALGIEVVDIPTGADSNFQPTLPVLERALAVLEAETGKGVDGLIVASPSNPTGTMLTPDELAALVRYSADKGIRFVSDEIYHGITYGRAAETALKFGRDVVVINSFSKYFSMTGWRLGWMVLPPDLLRAVECLGQNLFISPPTISQHAGIAAFDCNAELDANVARYARNRELLLQRLPKARFDKLASADGAFYIYADVGDLTNDSPEFCRRMLAETGVATTPGTDFDPVRGHRSVRFSFAGEEADMAEAAERLIAWRR
ncbi:MAG: aminotransferase class I/II-fold pyridoxal phosphate-dependent enzyme, partial [Rhodospirillaceae bacterium]